ncbi:hypothetical protein A2837_02280 [Candidatus Kaiserbacteria bacterium RIFCSPHIGHO2_01_FULL_46_22]|uniref:Uncharacterized protein n=1 Tax=Candidatus Kaiserbacteria bacterium RIFCSPHIGHO2_01_FULL_46_22 TaxID=1798475 RepID=A0A1F6BYM5_9BACT|nr:MAG: hypothetical protein A2837_02280 [Candidatus Kaiserbacteria bacterium RIFCSPHIGHO2_01_FULL_46_22]
MCNNEELKMLINAEGLQEDKKKLILLYRRNRSYRHSSVQSTVRFLTGRVPDVYIENESKDELSEAISWWNKQEETDRLRMSIEYKFAAKIF